MLNNLRLWARLLSASNRYDLIPARYDFWFGLSPYVDVCEHGQPWSFETKLVQYLETISQSELDEDYDRIESALAKQSPPRIEILE